ncbi:unnamed protein product [Brassica oleracea]
MRWDPIIKRYYSREANNNFSSALVQLFYKHLAQPEGRDKNIHFVIFETDSTELLKMIEYNTKLLEKGSYFIKRHVSFDNFRIMMNLLREPIKNIQIEAFHVFKLFVANEKKPEDIVAVDADKEDEGSEADR